MGKRFRVGFSFAGEKREFVSKVAEMLAHQFGQNKILYDIYHEAEFSRADLAWFLPKLYEQDVDLVVVIFSTSHNSKEWCRLEWRGIYSLLKKRRDNELLLARFDHVEPEDLCGLAGFVDLDEKTPEQLVTIILKRLAMNENKPENYYTSSIPDISGSLDNDERQSSGLISADQFVPDKENELVRLASLLGIGKYEMDQSDLKSNEIVATAPDGNKVANIESLYKTVGSTLLLIWGDDNPSKNRLAFFVARKYFTSATNYAPKPILIRPDNDEGFLYKVSTILTNLGMPSSGEIISKQISQRKLLPIIDCSSPKSEIHLMTFLNILPGAFVIVLANDNALLETFGRSYWKTFQIKCQEMCETACREPRSNLSKTSWPFFIGRKREQKQLIEQMSLSNPHEVFVVGMSGVGKTALVKKVAQENFCVKGSEYDFVLFYTAKLQELSPTGIVAILPDRAHSFNTLEDLSMEISRVCDISLSHVSPAQQEEKLRSFLRSGSKKLLIIIDNFETLGPQERKKTWKFFRDLKMHNCIKVVYTTRVHELATLDVGPLEEDEALKLVQSKRIDLPESYPDRLIQCCDRIPLAIEWSLALVDSGISPESVIDRLQSAQSDLLKYMFDDLVQLISDKDELAYKLLQSLTVTCCPLDKKAIQYILKIESRLTSQLYKSLQILVDFSLCNIVGEDQYILKSLVREYSSHLFHSDSEAKFVAQSNLITYFLGLAKENGGDDWGAYRDRFNKLEIHWDNIVEVFELLQNDWKKDGSTSYESSKMLWVNLKRFTYLYGYWTLREKWTDALIKEADTRGDTIFEAELWAANGWIKLLREGSENNANASRDFLKAIKILSEIDDDSSVAVVEVKWTIYLNLAATRVRQGDFTKALNTFREFLLLWRQQINRQQYRKIEKERRDKSRYFLRYLLYRGEYFYRCKNFIRAERYYERVERLCKEIDWQRFRAKAMERIAYLKIRGGQLNDAKDIIRIWSRESSRNGDKRRVAFFHKDSAMLYETLCDYSRAERCAEDALKLFKELDMENRINEVNDLVARVKSRKDQ